MLAALHSVRGTTWRILDDHFGGVTADDIRFLEADAYITNLNSQGSWRYINTRFAPFSTNYDSAERLYSSKGNGNVKKAMKEILQSVYRAYFDLLWT